MLDVTHHTTPHVHVMLVVLGLERYWYWVIGCWAIFTAIGQYCYWGIFFVVLTPNTIPIREQSAPSTCQWTIIHFCLRLVLWQLQAFVWTPCS